MTRCYLQDRDTCEEITRCSLQDSDTAGAVQCTIQHMCLPVVVAWNSLGLCMVLLYIVHVLFVQYHLHIASRHEVAVPVD